MAFIAGVALSFTPCVYPLLPVMTAAVAGANASGRASGGFLLSLLYVLGLAVSYSLLAIVAALTGKVFGSIQNNPWVMLVVANNITINPFLIELLLLLFYKQSPNARILHKNNLFIIKPDPKERKPFLLFHKNAFKGTLPLPLNLLLNVNSRQTI
ncbi:MAG: hypothetical protein HQL21_08745 [Candidatus Omnitrophica bacterium]|nr:hypothetical protein [Candidatus Omnitrophota bacterium]